MRKGPPRAGADRAKKTLGAGAEAHFIAEVCRDELRPLACGIWWVAPVEWPMGHDYRTRDSEAEFGALRINRVSEEVRLGSRLAPLDQERKSKTRSQAPRPHNQVQCIGELPQEIWLQITRYLVPTGGISHCTSVEQRFGQRSSGQKIEPYELGNESMAEGCVTKSGMPCTISHPRRTRILSIDSSLAQAFVHITT